MTHPTNDEILEKDKVASRTLGNPGDPQPTLCYYFRFVKAMAKDASFRQTLNLEANQRNLKEQYLARLQTIRQENAIIQNWLRYVELVPRLKLNLHNNKKSDLVHDLKIMLSVNNANSINNINPAQSNASNVNNTNNINNPNIDLLWNFVNDFAISGDNNLTSFASKREMEKRFDAASRFLSEMQIDPHLSSHLSVELQTKMAEQLALKQCGHGAQGSADAGANVDPNAVQNNDDATSYRANLANRPGNSIRRK